MAAGDAAIIPSTQTKRKGDQGCRLHFTIGAFLKTHPAITSTYKLLDRSCHMAIPYADKPGKCRVGFFFLGGEWGKLLLTSCAINVL